MAECPEIGGGVQIRVARIGDDEGQRVGSCHHISAERIHRVVVASQHAVQFGAYKRLEAAVVDIDRLAVHVGDVHPVQIEPEGIHELSADIDRVLLGTECHVEEYLAHVGIDRKVQVELGHIVMIGEAISERIEQDILRGCRIGEVRVGVLRIGVWTCAIVRRISGAHYNAGAQAIDIGESARRGHSGTVALALQCRARDRDARVAGGNGRSELTCIGVEGHGIGERATHCIQKKNHHACCKQPVLH